MNTFVKFSNFVNPDQEAVEYGPFEYVQMTYGSLRSSPDGEEFAYYANDRWMLSVPQDHPDFDKKFTDFVVWSSND